MHESVNDTYNIRRESEESSMFARPQPTIQHMGGVGRPHSHTPSSSGGVVMVTSLSVEADGATPTRWHGQEAWRGRADQHVSVQRLLEITISVISTVGGLQQIAVGNFLQKIFR